MGQRLSVFSVLTLLLTLLPASAIAQTQPPSAQRKPPMVRSIESPPSFLELLRRIFPDDERDDPPTISRGDLCLLAPARPGQETVIWHQRPVFIWQGDIGKLEVVDQETGDVFWRYEPTSEAASEAAAFVISTGNVNAIQYGGESLQPGRTYVWKVYESPTSTSAIAFPPFTLLPAVNRLLIANGLSVAEVRAMAAENPVELARAEYFAFRNLPVDALQSLFAVEQPSVELLNGRVDVVESMCD